MINRGASLNRPSAGRHGQGAAPSEDGSQRSVAAALQIAGTSGIR